MRVVAEPVRAAGLRDDLARPGSFRDHRLGILRVAQENDDAVVVRAPAVFVGQQFDQLFVVARIRPRLAGKPRRVYAGLSIERSRANTRVVCEGRQPRTAARVARLGERVLDESAVRLLGIGYSEARLRNDLHAEPFSGTIEVQNIGPDAVLTPEFPAPQTPAFEMAPQARFRGCESSAKFPAARFQSRDIVNKRHAR